MTLFPPSYAKTLNESIIWYLGSLYIVCQIYRHRLTMSVLFNSLSALSRHTAFHYTLSNTCLSLEHYSQRWLFIMQAISSLPVAQHLTRHSYSFYYCCRSGAHLKHAWTGVNVNVWFNSTQFNSIDFKNKLNGSKIYSKLLNSVHIVILCCFREILIKDF